MHPIFLQAQTLIPPDIFHVLFPNLSIWRFSTSSVNNWAFRFMAFSSSSPVYRSISKIPCLSRSRIIVSRLRQSWGRSSAITRPSSASKDQNASGDPEKMILKKRNWFWNFKPREGIEPSTSSLPRTRYTSKPPRRFLLFCQDIF